jgi:hypothetical protein
MRLALRLSEKRGSQKTKVRRLASEVREAKVLLEVEVTVFEPPAMGSGKDSVDKKQRVANILLEKIPRSELAELQNKRSSNLITLTVVFSLWKGSSKTTNTRFVKDLDSLLEVLFDALKPGPPGIGIIESDSYICEVHASKELVDTQEEEGFRLTLEKYKDEKMMKTLQENPRGP